jgi:transcriptional regulator with GAF, ATPase, and Fis domain
MALSAARESDRVAVPLENVKAVNDRTVDEFVQKLYADDDNLSLKQMMDELERMIIVKVLSKVNGHQRRAAKILGLKPTTLFEKAKRYRIRVEFKSILR